MNVSQQDARESLSKAHDVMLQTHRAIASAYASPLLILWGLLWVIAFTSSHFYFDYAFHIFMGMVVAGGIGTAAIRWFFYSNAPVRDTSCQKAGWRMAAFWVLLCVYVVIWLSLFAPFNGMQCNAFISTAAMFAYVVIGLWFNSCFMIVLGLAVTAVTLVGFFILTPYYCLWMAVMGGGVILASGLYVRLRWK